MQMGIFLIGALTVKPYSFRFRSWELESKQCVDIFDIYGSSVFLQIRGTRVFRVLPSEFGWISDKTRVFFFSCLA
jgi:NADH dehydrogenase/NADH:ubiquinone oxidoreductase subunit G